MNKNTLDTFSASFNYIISLIFLLLNYLILNIIIVIQCIDKSISKEKWSFYNVDIVEQVKDSS